MANDSINHFIQSDLESLDIKHDQCPKHKGYKSPNSYIIVNAKTGTRTILHTNLGLPELNVSNFKQIDFKAYSWIHFEGRPNIQDTKEIIQHIHTFHDKPKLSYEMEKVGRNYDPVMPLVDVLFLSKEYAQSIGYNSKLEVVKGFAKSKNLSNKIIICAWGEDGAAGHDKNGEVFEVPASKPKHGVVDTVGAGDTFNATVVASLSSGLSLKKALENGCRVAGKKVGQFGFSNLKEAFQS